MSASSYWRWAQLAHEFLTSYATGTLRYLAPGHYCTVEYPAKIKRNSRLGAVYQDIADQSISFYTFKASIWDSFGETELSAATFIAPSRVPTLPVDQYEIKWRTNLGAYIIDRRPSEPRNTYDISTNEITVSCESAQYHGDKSDVDSVFDIEYYEAKDEESWEEHYIDTVALHDTISSSFPVGLATQKKTITEDAGKASGLEWINERKIGDNAQIELAEVCDMGHMEDADILTPQSLNWADEVEDELNNSSVIGASSVEDEPVKKLNGAGDMGRMEDADILKPQSFNWADECEDQMNNNRIISAPTLPLKDDQEYPISAHIEEMGGEGHIIVDSSQLQHVTPENIENVSGTFSQNPAACKESEGSPSSTHSCSYDDQWINASEWLEKARQAQHMENNPRMHHINWLGRPVMERSETAPEHSLFVILCGPKPYFVETDTYKGAVLHQAMKYVDPVIYAGTSSDLLLTGHELVKAITGQVYQYYSAAGTWHQDYYGMDDVKPLYDPMDFRVYLAEPWMPMNGWVSNQIAPDRSEYIAEAHRIHDILKRSGRTSRRPYRRSGLGKCISVDSNDNVEAVENENLRLVQGRVQYLVKDTAPKSPTPAERLNALADEGLIHPLVCLAASIVQNGTVSTLAEDPLLHGCSLIPFPLRVNRAESPSGQKPLRRSKSCPNLSTIAEEQSELAQTDEDSTYGTNDVAESEVMVSPYSSTPEQSLLDVSDDCDYDRDYDYDDGYDSSDYDDNYYDEDELLAPSSPSSQTSTEIPFFFPQPERPLSRLGFFRTDSDYLREEPLPIFE